MTAQLSLFAAPAPSSLTCAFGTDWRAHGECAGCAAFAVDLARQFAADVAAGKYDADGFTPAERRAKERTQ